MSGIAKFQDSTVTVIKNLTENLILGLSVKILWVLEVLIRFDMILKHGPDIIKAPYERILNITLNAKKYWAFL